MHCLPGPLVQVGQKGGVSTSRIRSISGGDSAGGVARSPSSGPRRYLVPARSTALLFSSIASTRKAVDLLRPVRRANSVTPPTPEEASAPKAPPAVPGPCPRRYASRGSE